MILLGTNLVYKTIDDLSYLNFLNNLISYLKGLKNNIKRDFIFIMDNAKIHSTNLILNFL